MELPIDLNSLWKASAPTWEDTPLDGDAQADLVIIGAGITGLTAALKAVEGGKRVIVLDAHSPGWGASGRNGGQVIPGLKEEPDEIYRRFGPEQGARVVRFAGSTADALFDLVKRHSIDCDARRGGWVEPVYNARSLRALDRKTAQWQAQGAEVEMLDRDGIARVTGSHIFAGGFLDHRAGSVQPLKYTLGLAAAARRLGANICSGVTVTGIDRQANEFIVQTNSGQGKTHKIGTSQVLLCTNGYSDPAFSPLGQPVGRSVAQIASIQVATDPLPLHLQQKIMADGISGSDSNRLLVYFRLDAHGRFLIGGRGATFAAGLNRLYPGLRTTAIKMFPDLADVAWPWHWGGMLALTQDHYPHLHEPVPGFMIAMGYNGRGIALASQWGTAMADYAINRDKSVLPIPFSPVKAFPFHRLRTVGIEATAFWYGLLDRLGV
ncbi:MAG: glycine/D-amino acid oxidase-like deaminating enzyme [Motiliproteus sp.]|jgi:glycine/D-amino acid oxidase-like deaminating enzyme